MLNSGLHKPPLAPKPKIVHSQKPGLSPATPRREGLSILSPATTRKPKPGLAPKPIFPKVADAQSPGPNKRQATDPDSIVGLLNSQNGIHQERKRQNWDYVISICVCHKENCKCIPNEPFSKIGKGLAVQDKSKSEEIKHVTENIEENNKLASPVSENNTQNDPPMNSSNDNISKNSKPFQEVLALYQNFKTVDNIYSPTRTNKQSLPHKIQDEAIANVVSEITPKEEKLGSPSSSIQMSAPFLKPAPVPVPRKPRPPVVTGQEKMEEEIVYHEVSEVPSEVKNSPSVSVGAPVSTHLNNQSRIPKPTFTLPAQPPRKKQFLSDIGKSFNSEDVEEEDLGSDVPDMELSVDKSDNEVENKDSPVSSPVQEEMSLAPQKPLRDSSPLAKGHRGESFEGASRKGELPVQDGKDVAMRALPLPPDDKTAKSGTLKSSTLTKAKAKSFSSADASRPGNLRKSSFKKLLELKLAITKKLTSKGVQAQESSDSEGDYEDVFIPTYKGERKLSCPLIELDKDGQHAETENYYEEIVSDYINVDVRDGENSPGAGDVSPSPKSNEDEEGLYEVQDCYLTMDRNNPRPPLELYDIPRPFNQEDITGIRQSDQERMGNTTDEDHGVDDFDTSSVSSKGGEHEQGSEPEQTGMSATLEKKKSKIKNIVTEIMSSENVFVDVLKLLHVDFRNAVCSASQQKGKPIIEDQLLGQILYYLPQLFEFNQELLQELQQRVATWEDDSKVADIFVKKGAFLKMYATYIRDYDKNVAVLEEQTKKNPAFGAVVQEFEARPACASLALRHYLLKPVQRIPQYKMLLTDYLKNLSEDSSDYKNTIEALAIVTEVASHANDNMKQEDIFQKIIQVQCKLIGNHELVQPGRVFLKEGIVNKLSRKTLQPRKFFLFNDMLLYTTPVQSGHYKVKHEMSLAGMKVRKPAQEAFQNEFIIESVERSFICSTSSATERDKWFEAIETAILDYTKKKTSFFPTNKMDLPGAIGSKAPPWIPDQRVTMCMVCACEFTLTWRRHHCRGCGWVVCQLCSSNKYPLKYLKNQLARVCNSCFLVLQKEKNEKAISCPVGKISTFAMNGKRKKIPLILREVSANTMNPTMSGYLHRIKPNKKQGKKKWFVIKGNILYTYAASADVVALASLPLLGFTIKSDSELQFRILHNNKLYYVFKADDELTAQRWVDAMNEASELLT